MANCIFCEIVNGNLNSIKVYEDEKIIGFLDIRPLFLGHLLMVPKKHFDTFYDLPNDYLTALMLATQKVGKALEKATTAQGTFLAMNNRVSQSVPHVHMHVVPRNPKDGLKGFFWPRQKFTVDEMQLIAKKIADLID